MSWRPAWWLDVLKIYWPLNHWSARATGLPVVGRLITYLVQPLFSQKNFQISYLPVNANIEPAVSTILTEGIIAELIRRSAHRVIIKRCSCRDAKGCQNFPSEDSCMLLGYDTRQISAGIARHVSVDEALTHLKSQIALGLIPMTGRVRMDDLYYGVPNRNRMLTICFCCPCCCTVLNSAKYFPDKFRSSLVKLEGVHVVVDPETCIQCGNCIEACFMEAIMLQDGSIVHDETRCIGCGRCSSVCPEKATRVVVVDSHAAVAAIMARIEQRINIQ